MKNKINILIVDDHKLFAEGLRKLLELEHDIQIVGEASDGKEAIQKTLTLKPDIVIMDINMATLSGVEAAKEIKKVYPQCKIIIVTAYDDESYISSLGEVEIDGFVLKASGLKEILSAIRTVTQGDSYIDPKAATKILTIFHKRKTEKNKLSRLTQRELEVLYWLSHGLSNEEIAEKMILSTKTIRNHISHILKKLELNDRTKAAVFAWKHGIPHQPPPGEEK